MHAAASGKWDDWKKLLSFDLTPIVPTEDTSHNPADHRSNKKPIEVQKPTKLQSNMNIKHAVFGYGR
jgi:hypothetical protein